MDLVEELGVGLVVMGSRGFGGVRRALTGSVSDSVTRHAHCPMSVVRNEGTDIREGEEQERSMGRRKRSRKILLATDGSADAILAARATADVSKGTGEAATEVPEGLQSVYERCRTTRNSMKSGCRLWKNAQLLGLFRLRVREQEGMVRPGSAASFIMARMKVSFSPRSDERQFGG